MSKLIITDDCYEQYVNFDCDVITSSKKKFSKNEFYERMYYCTNYNDTISRNYDNINIQFSTVS